MLFVTWVYIIRPTAHLIPCLSPWAGITRKERFEIKRDRHIAQVLQAHETNAAVLPSLRYYGYVFPTGMGQSSSVIEDQKTQTMITESSVKRVSKSAPSILPFVPLQM